MFGMFTATAAVTALTFVMFAACDGFWGPIGPPTSTTDPSYTLTYNINGGSGTTPASQEVNIGSSVTLRPGTGFSRSGFTFSGWNTNSGGTGTNYSAGASFTPTEDITLFARWVRTSPTVTYNINGGTGTTPASQTVNAGSSVTLRAGTGFSRSGFTFSSWNTNSNGTGTNYSAGASFTPTDNITLFARWQVAHTLTVNRNPTAGGTVTPSSSQSGIAPETAVNISAAPASGYTFVNWTVTSGTATFGNANSATTTVTLSTNATIRANFEQIRYTLTVNRNPTAGGTVTPSSAQSIAAGTAFNISATVNSGYRFVNWTVTSGTATFGNAASAATTVTLSSNATVRANFELIPTHTLTVNRDPTAGGTVTPASSQSGIAAGTAVNITATPASGYTFVNWTVTSGTATFGNANNATTTVTLSTNATIRANFQQIPTYTLTLNRNPTAGGTVTPASPQTGIAPGTAVNISASVNSGYMFVHWTVESGTATFGNANNTSTTVTLSSNATIRANFQLISTYTLTVNTSGTGSGSVTRSVGGSTTTATSFNAGTTVTLTAQPNSGSTFSGWSGGGCSGTGSCMVTMTQNVTVTATFTSSGSGGNACVGGSFTDARDSRTYRCVTIGTQTWMAENLNYNASGSVCYNNDPGNCNTYGRLYDWNTVMAGASSSSSSPSGVRGICPVGWHVPSDAEWTTLTDFVGGASIAGTRLKSTSGWNSGGNDTDDHGFSALPGGSRWADGSFNYVGSSGGWWSATEHGASYAWYRYMLWDYSDVYRWDSGKTRSQLSLRCLQD
jgi:uncharacterized protein (TIGR02145 family)/uncharacterized repeat protein (TIGR02543 family)